MQINSIMEFRTYTSYVRGKRIPFDDTTIIFFLGNKDHFGYMPLLAYFFNDDNESVANITSNKYIVIFQYLCTILQ